MEIQKLIKNYIKIGVVKNTPPPENMFTLPYARIEMLFGH